MNLWRNTTVITKKLTNPKNNNNNNNNKADLRTLSINTRGQKPFGSRFLPRILEFQKDQNYKSGSKSRFSIKDFCKPRSKPAFRILDQIHSIFLERLGDVLKLTYNRYIIQCFYWHMIIHLKKIFFSLSTSCMLSLARKKACEILMSITGSKKYSFFQPNLIQSWFWFGPRPFYFFYHFDKNNFSKFWILFSVWYMCFNDS